MVVITDDRSAYGRISEWFLGKEKLLTGRKAEALDDECAEIADTPVWNICNDTKDEHPPDLPVQQFLPDLIRLESCQTEYTARPKEMP